MFRSVLVKLTLWYLVVVMAISVVFSILLYRVISAELDRGLRRQERAFHQLGTPPPTVSGMRRQTVAQAREAQLAESRRHAKAQLLYANLAILVLSGAGSYLFARQTLRPIEQAHAAQSRFTADASHELRTPLAAMRTEIDVALREKKLTETGARRLLRSNLEEVARLESLSSALLTLSRFQGGQQTEAFSSVSLRDAAREAAARLKTHAKKKRVTIEMSRSAAQVQGNADSLVQLLTILLDNAIKYSPADSTVTLRWTRQTQEAVVTVTDRGVGIPPGDVPRIFERFYRADSSRTRREHDGYGLGLAIAQEIVRMHRGTIDVQSRPGAGSTFRVTLPGTGNPKRTLSRR